MDFESPRNTDRPLQYHALPPGSTPLPRIRLVHVELAGNPVETSPITLPEQAARVLCEFIGNRDRECFVTMHLDARNRALSVELVSVGTLVASLVHPREVFKAATLQNAAAIICGHNHPSGELTPSADDLAIYQRLKAAGDLVGILVLDFLIVGGGQWRQVGSGQDTSGHRRSGA
ncbi:MAG: JAB domain-containing protein [Dehalococcoidia bacterium]